jgi:hypothetical protein
MAEQHKICSKCRIEKPLDAFWPAKKERYGRNSQCKTCRNEQRRAAYAENPEKYKGRQIGYSKTEKGKRIQRICDLRKTYGITQNDFERMENAQNGVCAICGKPETTIHALSGMVQRLSIDHSHKTGKIRGLLCSRCNTKLGLLEDIEFVTRAKLYLATHA